MNKPQLIQAMHEATQRAVGDNSFKIEIVYSRIADAVMGLFTVKGKTMKGFYKAYPINLFIEDKAKWKVWRKRVKVKSKEVKGWHYV